jgi:hypothetical protein
MKMKATLWLTCLLTIVLAGSVNADVLEMPEAMPEQPMPEQSMSEPEAVPESGTFTVTLPGKGMTKDQVEDRFGSPPEKVGSVGEPPISRWVYSGFTVYFEYDHVIHAVNHK